MEVCILYYIPNSTIKYTAWHDGFTAAIDILKGTFNIDMINAFDKPTINFDKYDLVFFKESFTGNIYNKYKSSLTKKNKLGLFISSSCVIPNQKQLDVYDVLFYETHWYYNHADLKRHPNTCHAFGVDTSIMKETNEEKVYDVIFVGNICDYKRPLKILDLPGKKICLGFKTDQTLIKKLTDNGVEVIEFIEYDKLATYYNQSKLCYTPCTLHGGGERCVLEARSCGIPVKIETDNPKLEELTGSEIYSSVYYAKQIEKGLWNILHGSITNSSYHDILRKFKNLKLEVLEVGGMDGKTFDPMYSNLSKKWKLTVLEPVHYQFNKLTKNYTNHTNTRLLNKALNYTNDDTKMFTIKPGSLETNRSIPMWANGISSFYNDRNSLGKNYWDGRGKVHLKNGLDFDTIKDDIEEINVKCVTVDELNFNRIDILQSDTEGFDYHILNIVLSKFKPYIIMFEWNNLPQHELDKTKQLLVDYDIKFGTQDALCILRKYDNLLT